MAPYLRAGALIGLSPQDVKGSELWELHEIFAAFEAAGGGEDNTPTDDEIAAALADIEARKAARAKAKP